MKERLKKLIIIKEDENLPPLNKMVLLKINLIDKNDEKHNFKDLAPGRRYFNGQGGFSYQLYHPLVGKMKDFVVIGWLPIPTDEELEY